MPNPADQLQAYEPSPRFNNVDGLYGNHFKFTMDAFPDLTFFVQNVGLPSVISSSVPRGNPFVTIPEVGDHLAFSTFDVAFLLDRRLKTYFSLYYWMCGYGFPRSYEEVQAFREARARRTANPAPLLRELEKTRAHLLILQADTSSTLAEVHYEDVFPVSLSGVTFDTDQNDTPQLKATATFACSYFDVVLKEDA